MKTLIQKVSLGAFLVLLVACASRGPVTTQYGGTEIKLNPSEIEILSPTQGKSCVPVILGFQFAQNSVQEAESQALSAVGADMLLDKVNYFALESQIGGQCFAVPGAGVVCGGMLYASSCQYVEGIGVKLK